MAILLQNEFMVMSIVLICGQLTIVTHTVWLVHRYIAHIKVGGGGLKYVSSMNNNRRHLLAENSKE